MVADVGVGALLSGTLDASTIVAAMCRAADPGEITTICAAILDLFADPARAARMGAAARSFVEQTWTWEPIFCALKRKCLVLWTGANAQCRCQRRPAIRACRRWISPIAGIT